MTTLAIVTVDGGGNLPPALAIASRFSERGHEVHVLGHERQRDIVTAAGHPFTPLSTLGFWNPGARRSVPKGVEEARRLSASRALEREVGGRLGRIGAEVALVDGLMASSARATEALGVPTVVLFHTFLEYWERSFRRGPIGMLARMQGNPLRAWDAATARIVTSDESFDPAAARRGAYPTTTWVGAIVHGAPSMPDRSRPPVVMVSLSTMWFPGQTDVYQRVVTALGHLPVRGVVTLGGLALDHDLSVPPNVEVHDMADHDDLLPQVSLVVGHGGHSTTFRALAHGVPVLAMPMHPLLDQPMVADALARAGVGLHLPRMADSARIAEAVASLLADDGARERAARLGERLRSTDAAATAADLLERVAAHRSAA